MTPNARIEQESVATQLRVGSIAPDFTLPDQNDQPLTLSSLRGTSVVLFFYPSAFTPGCTAEACSFRDEYETFREKGAEVVGISSNAASTQASFARIFKLPFRLLSDADGRVRSLYAVPRTMGIFPGRSTFVIDPSGVIRHSFTSQFRATSHIADALRVLESLRS